MEKVKYTVYILYSALLDKYYTGYTSMTLEDRIERHMQNHGGFTSQTKDWVSVLCENFEDKSEAKGKELIIKKRGAKRYIQDQIDKEIIRDELHSG